MSAIEPSLFTDSGSLEYLKHLFRITPDMPTFEQEGKNAKADEALTSVVQPQSSSINEPDIDSEGKQEAETAQATMQSQESESEVANAEAKEISLEHSEKVKIDHFITQEDENAHILLARQDVASVFKDLVELIKNGRVGELISQLPEMINFAPPEALPALLKEKDAQLTEMRSLLVEAQSTIIKLLTDRVDDRARLAALESELRLLPELQNQSDAALALAISAEDVRRDLSKVKVELEKFKSAPPQTIDTVVEKPSIWGSFRGWFSKGR